MKLELKYLSLYLPYKLLGASERNGTFFYLDTYSNMLGKGIENREIESWLNNGIKPILRPLSDLTKEIDHNGEKFIPIEYNAFKDSKEHIIYFQNKYAHYKSVKFGIMERLLEWHFDVFGLIEKGLAIDINTIKS